MRGFLFLLLLTLLAVRSAAAEQPIPIDAFFREAEISQPRLSKDGSRIVLLIRNRPARASIAVWDARTHKGSVVFVPNDYNVDFAFWKSDRIVFGGDRGGNESFALRSIRADGSGLRDLSESLDDRNRYEDGPVGGNLYSTLPDDPEHVLVAGRGTRRKTTGELLWGGALGFYRLNVGSGIRVPVENFEHRATGYFVDDRSGHIFGRITQSGGDQVVELKAPDGDYKKFAQVPGATLPWQFVGLLPGERSSIMQVRDTEHDRGALYEFDLQTLKRGAMLYAPKEGEITDIFRAPNGRIVGIGRETERTVYDWFDPKWGRAHASLLATFPGKEVALVSATDDVRFVVALVYSDRDPGTYYLFDTEKPQLTVIGAVNPKLDPSRMASREPIAYRARDGLELHGYLTRPPGSGPGPHPLVVVPHGGPFGIRDSWHFDADSQFLASRGYAVLQVNYRGSGGYGFKFEAAGKRQWGRAMQDDLTDGVQWAIREGIADAERVAIYGASYGGYAALAGAAFTPDLYRCAVNYVGVSDLLVLRRPNEGTAVAYDRWFDEWIGNDDAQLRAQSPARHVADIRIPTLHAYGENDPRVDIAHWKVLEPELRKNGKSYQYLRERDEGHGFEDETSRIKFYAALEQFLQEHLPTRGKVMLGELKTTELPARESK